MSDQLQSVLRFENFNDERGCRQEDALRAPNEESASLWTGASTLYTFLAALGTKRSKSLIQVLQLQTPLLPVEVARFFNDEVLKAKPQLYVLNGEEQGGPYPHFAVPSEPHLE